MLSPAFPTPLQLSRVLEGLVPEPREEFDAHTLSSKPSLASAQISFEQVSKPYSIENKRSMPEPNRDRPQVPRPSKAKS